MFNEWLLSQLQERDWSQADLARASGLTRPAISNYINGRVPDQSAIRKIAKAFKLSDEIVFRAAGILKPSKELDERRSSFQEMLEELPDDDVDDLLAIARAKIERRQAQKKLRPAS